MDPRFREDDRTEARACPERTVMPVPVSFLALSHSCACVIPGPASFLALRHSCACVIPVPASFLRRQESIPGI
jgi:hypothetical protein